MPRRKTVPVAKTSAPVPEAIAVTPTPAIPSSPTPAVLELQKQIVDFVAKRTESATHLRESHATYLAAQTRFQVAQNEMQGIEQEVSYRINLIAQLENRSAPAPSFPQSIDLGTNIQPTPQQIASKVEAAYGQDDMVNRGHASRSLVNQQF